MIYKNLTFAPQWQPPLRPKPDTFNVTLINKEGSLPMSFFPTPLSSSKLCNTQQPLNQQLYNNQKKNTPYKKKQPTTEYHCKKKVFQEVH